MKYQFINSLRVITFLLVFSNFGCENQMQNQRHHVQITEEKKLQLDSLIVLNNDRMLFLNFWSGMSRKEFLSLLEFENLNGRLINGKFKLVYPHGREISTRNLNEILLSVEYENNAIVLTYSDKLNDRLKNYGVKKDYWASYDEYYRDAEKYESVITHLIETFDDRYDSVIDEILPGSNHNNSTYWITGNINDPLIINLQADLTCVYYRYNTYGSPDLNGFKINRRKKTVLDYTERRLLRYRINDKMDLMKFELKVTYRLASEYMNDYEERNRRIRENQEGRRKEEEKVKKILEKNRDML